MSSKSGIMYGETLKYVYNKRSRERIEQYWRVANDDDDLGIVIGFENVVDLYMKMDYVYKGSETLGSSPIFRIKLLYFVEITPS